MYSIPDIVYWLVSLITSIQLLANFVYRPRCKYCLFFLSRAWQKEMVRHKAGKSASFVRALARAFGVHYAMAGILVLTEVSHNL